MNDTWVQPKDFQNEISKLMRNFTKRCEIIIRIGNQYSLMMFDSGDLIPLLDNLLFDLFSLQDLTWETLQNSCPEFNV